MEDMELWSVTSAQLVAVAALLAAALGTLRQRKVLPAEAVEATFRIAERHLPAGAPPAGANLLAYMRMIAEVAARDRDGDPPPG